MAIITTESFDASTIDPSTIIFAAASPVKWSHKDVDNDGDLDMFLHFKTRELDLTLEDSEATLIGETYNGVQITGTDIVNTETNHRK